MIGSFIPATREQAARDAWEEQDAELRDPALRAARLDAARRAQEDAAVAQWLAEHPQPARQDQPAADVDETSDTAGTCRRCARPVTRHVETYYLGRRGDTGSQVRHVDPTWRHTDGTVAADCRQHDPARVIAGGTICGVTDYECVCYETPGHAPGHRCACGEWWT